MSASYICKANLLVEGNKGIRFPVTVDGHDATGFVIRFGGNVYGYLNRCAHVSIELDWSEGEFFESSGLYLMCASHGAIYYPDTGLCAGGPCRGGKLRNINVFEDAGDIFWLPDEVVKPVRA